MPPIRILFRVFLRDIISITRTMVSKQVCDRVSNEKNMIKNGCFILRVTCETMKIKLLFSRDFNFIRTGKNGLLL